MSRFERLLCWLGISKPPLPTIEDINRAGEQAMNRMLRAATHDAARVRCRLGEGPWLTLSGKELRRLMDGSIPGGTLTIDNVHVPTDIRLDCESAASENTTEEVGVEHSRCDKAAPGWRCTREEGHEGPCAAVETSPGRRQRSC